MAETTEISWCDATINLWWGCSKVSPGCANCYADSFSKRWGKDIWGKGKPREDHRAGAIKTAMKLNRQAEKEAKRLRVFSASMSDWLDDEVPKEWQNDLLRLIEATPHLDWLLLTKRPENWEGVMTNALLDGVDMVHEWVNGRPPANVWIGTTVEDQARADERIPLLLDIPAMVRFLSCEPLLEAVDVACHFRCHFTANGRWPGLNWIICGGESGPGFRPFNPDWARSLRDQCKAAGVAFHMKQMGGMRPNTMPPIPDDLMIREYPTSTIP
jgi:protein gp37